MRAILKSVSRARRSSPMRARKLARSAVVLEGFLVRVDGARAIARLEEVLDRLVGHVRLAEVAGEEPEGLLRRLAVDLLQRLADALVELPPRRLDEARVGDLLDEPVAEAELRVGAAAHLDDEVEALELGQRRLELARAARAARAAEGRMSCRSRRRSESTSRVAGSRRSSRACSAPWTRAGMASSSSSRPAPTCRRASRAHRARSGRGAPPRGRTGCRRSARRGGR